MFIFFLKNIWIKIKQNSKERVLEAAAILNRKHNWSPGHSRHFCERLPSVVEKWSQKIFLVSASSLRVEIRDVIKTPAKCKQRAIAVFSSSDLKHLAVKIFSMEIAESFEEWDDPDIETLSTNLICLVLGREEEEIDESDCSGSEEDMQLILEFYSAHVKCDV